SGSKTDIPGSTGTWTVSIQNYWRAWKSKNCNLRLQVRNGDEQKRGDRRLHYGRPARSDASRAKGRRARVGAAIPRASGPAGSRSSFRWLRPGSYFARGLRIGRFNSSNWNGRQRRARAGSKTEKSRNFTTGLRS